MTNTDRLLLIIVGINLMFGLITQFSNPSGEMDTTHLSQYNTNINAENAHFLSDANMEGGAKSESGLQEASSGSLWAQSKFITTAFIRGVVPYQIPEEVFNTPWEKTVLNMWQHFHALILTIGILRTFQIIKNKRSD